MSSRYSLSSTPTPDSHKGLCWEHARAQQNSALWCPEKARNSSPICKSWLRQILSLCSSLCPSSHFGFGALAGTRDDCRNWVPTKQVLCWQPRRLVGPRNFPTPWKGKASGAWGRADLCSCRVYAVHKPHQAHCWQWNTWNTPSTAEVSENKTHLLPGAAGKRWWWWHIHLSCISRPCCFFN